MEMKAGKRSATGRASASHHGVSGRRKAEAVLRAPKSIDRAAERTIVNIVIVVITEAAVAGHGRQLETLAEIAVELADERFVRRRLSRSAPGALALW